MKLITCLGIACLMACNSNENLSIKGHLQHYKAKNIKFEICAQDTTISASIDSSGYFEATLPLKESGYIRISNSKATLPIYAEPKQNIQIEADIQKLREGDYHSVKMVRGDCPETQMMIDYYQKQWFPSTEEMFVLPPTAFRQLIDSVVRFNDSLITRFIESNPCHAEFVELFRLQVKIPLATSYFYYPMYHALLNPQDKSETPEDFNIFDGMLPKNNIGIYRKVYRYKTYEISYWNHFLQNKLSHLRNQPALYVSAYIEGLAKLKLEEQIRDDIAFGFISQQYRNLPEDAVTVLRQRYEDIIASPHYRQIIDSCLQNKTL